MKTHPPFHMDSVARYICNRSRWEISNLELQKLMYFAQLIYLGKHNGARLFDGQFEARDYGPVLPELYSRLLIFGGNAISADVFVAGAEIPADSNERRLLDTLCDTFLDVPPTDLIRIAYRENSAWAKCYKPKDKASVSGAVITDAAMKEEFANLGKNGARHA